MFTVSAAEARHDAATEEEPPLKRQRLDAKPPSISENSVPAAFHLLRTEGIAAEANECEANPMRQDPARPCRMQPLTSQCADDAGGCWDSG
jgi:hypothetical protein